MTAKKPAPTKPTKAAAKAGADDKHARKAAVKPVPAKAPARPVAKPPAKSAPVKPAAKGSAKAAEAAKGARGAKAKGAPPAGKKEALVDEDFVDIDAEVEVEADAEAAGDAESKAKAKPLRMKVSRAKERALMREFGLEETTLTEEEVAKRRQELKTLIKMGKTRGFLTHQEINDHLPEKLVNEEILEAIVSMLNDMGIAVYEQAPDAATLLVAGGGTTTATEEEAEEAAEAALREIEIASGCRVISLPLQDEFHIDLGFDLGSGKRVTHPPRRVEAMVPASPTPLTPSGFDGHGVGDMAMRIGGRSSACGMA